MTAHALARTYAALIGEVDGVRLISAGRTGAVSTAVRADVDRVLGAPIPKGLGYFLGLPEMGGAAAFGCKGSGGGIAFADPARGFAFAFIHNRLAGPADDNAALIAGTVRDALGRI
jgi:CubicO group peptidase (beta-lactamase class C family)